MTMDLVSHLNAELVAALLAHAAREAPRECCGLLVGDPDAGTLHYLPGDNVYRGATGEDRFELDPEAWVGAESFGEVVAVVHSHPNASANPSMADRAGCERSGVPWLIVGWPSGVIKQLDPCGWQAPYKGRTFHHGVMDCYTLIQDWYQRELGIPLPDCDRDDEWWRHGQDLYMQGFGQAGFVRVSGEPRRHDVFLIQVHADVANHGAVYLGDGEMLHHLVGRLSESTVYGGYWQRHTLALLRHETLLGAAA